MGNIYDGAFQTILNDCRQMIIPVINEIFKEDYTGNEIIEFHPNEHFIEQQDAVNQERITDTNFIILWKEKEKIPSGMRKQPAGRADDNSVV